MFVLEGTNRWNLNRQGEAVDLPASSNTRMYNIRLMSSIKSMNRRVLGTDLLPDFKAPGKPTCELMAVEYLLAQSGKGDFHCITNGPEGHIVPDLNTDEAVDWEVVPDTTCFFPQNMESAAATYFHKDDILKMRMHQEHERLTMSNMMGQFLTMMGQFMAASGPYTPPPPGFLYLQNTGPDGTSETSSDSSNRRSVSSSGSSDGSSDCTDSRSSVSISAFADRDTEFSESESSVTETTSEVSVPTDGGGRQVTRNHRIGAVMGTVRIIPNRNTINENTDNAQLHHTIDEEAAVYLYEGGEDYETQKASAAVVYREMEETRENGLDIDGKNIKVQCTSDEELKQRLNIRPCRVHILRLRPPFTDNQWRDLYGIIPCRVMVSRQIAWPHLDWISEWVEQQLDSRGEAVGVSKKQADPLSYEDESRLWDSNTITTETSQGLSYGAFFYNCKLFGLRGMDEHQRLMLDQYKFGTDNNGRYLRYTGRFSKNFQDGLQQRQVGVKDLKQYASPTNPRCVVNLFEQYFQTNGNIGGHKDDSRNISGHKDDSRNISGHKDDSRNISGNKDDSRNISGHKDDSRNISGHKDDSRNISGHKDDSSINSATTTKPTITGTGRLSRLSIVQPNGLKIYMDF
ncbi:Hypp6780 [Branchiostoma lanceolatum]|uniref:Hypp6780 protein n=1 Tax=Branchiostoma lanceolatum TaxID=7740 RepID=A0A8K0EAM8_BRALA|nr:Hypp6780 [Branchiostoma lanceolatum]